MNILDHSYTAYINLAQREDRRQHMERELDRIGVRAVRFPAIDTTYQSRDAMFYPSGKVRKMLLRTPGAIGCHYSQVSVMQVALTNYRHAFVMEDDLIFCSDFKERINHIERFLRTHDWDIFWLGGTFHVNPAQWHTARHPEVLSIIRDKDVECTDDTRVVRTYGAFSTFAYIVNVQSIRRILTLLDEYVHESIGIDYLFIKLQPFLKTYAFVPGCVRQMDNRSDIGNGDTIFSNFRQLGPYWFQDRMEEFDPTAFNWAEAVVK